MCMHKLLDEDFICRVYKNTVISCIKGTYVSCWLVLAVKDKEARPKAESEDDRHNEPYVFKFEKRFNFKDIDPRNWSNWVPLALALAAGYMLTKSGGQPRQLSWQEFRSHYLERGEVERLEVVNRSLVRAYLRSDSASQVRGGTSLGYLNPHLTSRNVDMSQWCAW